MRKQADESTILLEARIRTSSLWIDKVDTHDEDSVNAEEADHTACGRVASHPVANRYGILREVAA